MKQSHGDIFVCIYAIACYQNRNFACTIGFLKLYLWIIMHINFNTI